MTELDLYKFIEKTDSETRFDGELAIMWVSFFNLAEFTNLIGYGVLDEGGLEVRLQEDGIAVKMNWICEYHQIELESIFEKEV